MSDIRQKLKAFSVVSGQRVVFKNDTATVACIETMLRCKVLHFAGLGIPRGDLAFEDNFGDVVKVPSARIRELLAGSAGPSLVLVSAVVAREVGQTFIDAGVTRVVTIKLEPKVV